MTDKEFLINPQETFVNPVGTTPTVADKLQSAMGPGLLVQSEGTAEKDAQFMGGVLFDLYRKANAEKDPNQTDEDARAEAVYFSKAMTGVDDVPGKLWKKGGYATGFEYRDAMHDFFLNGGKRNLTPEFVAFSEMGYDEQVQTALESRKTLETIAHAAGIASGGVADFFMRRGEASPLSDAERGIADADTIAASELLTENETYVQRQQDARTMNADIGPGPDRAKLAEATQKVKDFRTRQYNERVRQEHYQKLLADNAWYELSSVMPKLSPDAQSCVKAIMDSADNALPESDWAKFNNLSDEEKGLVARARTVLKPNVEGNIINTLGDMAIGAANVATAVATAPYKYFNKQYLDLRYVLEPNEMFDVNALAKKRQYLWNATGRFDAGGSEHGYLPQMQFEQICEEHGVIAEALIGAVSTLPYMAAAAAPGGIAWVALEAMSEMDDNVAMQGGDITDPDYLVTSFIMGGLYAYTERLQVEGLLGGVGEMKVKEALLGGVFQGMVKRPTVRNLTVGTLSESVQEGLQNGIAKVNEALALDQDTAKAFGEGFAEDFIGSLGTMAVVEAGGLVGGHWRRSGFNNAMTASGREAGRAARSKDLLSEYDRSKCLDDMVRYDGISKELRNNIAAIEWLNVHEQWKKGGTDALRNMGLTAEQATEFDYYFKRELAQLEGNDLGEEAVDERQDRAFQAINEYIAGESKRLFDANVNDERSRAAFDAAMNNMAWVRDAWAQGAGIRRTDEEGNVQDPGATALEKLGFTKEVAKNLSDYFHLERANAYSQAAIAGIRTRYEAQMAGRVTAKAALAKQFGGNLMRYDGADYLTFDRGNGVLQMVRIDETKGGIDFANAKEGDAVSIEKVTNGAVKAKDWMNMSAEERERTWDEYGLVNEGAFTQTPSVKVTLPADPSVGVDSTQAAQIVGRIALDTQTRGGEIRDTSAAYHEVFHAFAAFAQASGLWTKEDIAYLEKTFGKAKHSKETFDEETGAEGFRSFLARRVNGALTADDEHSPFMKIYAAAAGLDRVAKEREANERVAARNETAFFQQLIAEANRPKPKPAAKPNLTRTEAPQKGLKKEAQAEETEKAPTQTAEEAKPEQTTEPTKVNIESPRVLTRWESNVPNTGIKVKGYWQAFYLDEIIDSASKEYEPQGEMQKRFRKDNNVSEAKLKQIERDFFPKYYLHDAASTSDGAPIIAMLPDEKGVVRPFVNSGNGRVDVLRTLSKNHMYDLYRKPMMQFAADNGIPLPEKQEGREIVICRVIDDLGGSTLEEIARMTNTENTTPRTEIEQARTDSETIRNNNLAHLYVPTDTGTPNMLPGVNDKFFTRFRETAADGLTIFNGKSGVTQNGQHRLKRAMVYLACGQGERGPATVQKMFEMASTLGIDRQVVALERCAPWIAALENEPSYSIGEDVSRAAADFMDYVEKKRDGTVGTFQEYLGQEDLFEDYKRSEIADDLMKMMGKLKSPIYISEVVKQYCKSAMASDEKGALKDYSRKRMDIWNAAKKLIDEKVEKGELSETDDVVETTTQDTQEPTDEQEETTDRKTQKKQGLSTGTITIGKQTNNDKPVTLTVGKESYTVVTKKGTVSANLPNGAYTGLRKPYDPYVETPESDNPESSVFKGIVTKQNDPEGRYWGDKMPQFMGHKTEMFDRTVMTLRQKMTPDELANYDTVVDYFGGGGCWGMSLALATMKNVKRIIINEFDPGRAKKIELLQTLGKDIADIAEKMMLEDGTLNELREIIKTKGKDGGESGSGSTIANTIIKNFKNRYANDKYKLGLMYAVTDCASRQLGGSKDVRDKETGEVSKVNVTFDERWEKIKKQLSLDGKNATSMRKAFENRGGNVEYVNGDSTKNDFGVGFETPHGGNVMSVCDPPYYRTTGYSDDGSSWTVGLKSVGLGYAYEDTLNILERLIDNGDGLVYTDEAWWLKPEYLETHNVHDDGLFDDASIIASSPEFRQENEILERIRNLLDHFDVAGQVAKRYETLGVHHGKQIARNGISRNDGQTEERKRRNTTTDGNVGSTANERGGDNDSRIPVRGMVGRTEGEDVSVLRNGGENGQGSVRTEDVVRDAIASIQDAAVEAKVGAVDKSATEDIVRNSIRQVREDKQLAYANAVSANAVEYLKREAAKLDRYMADHGYTEKEQVMTPEAERAAMTPGATPVTLTVYRNPKDKNDFKTADPVTFMRDTEGEMPIPMEWRADPSMPDVRYSIAMGNRAKEEARRMIEKYRPGLHYYTTMVDGVLTPQDDAAVDAIAKFETPKERKAALMWFCKKTVRLPEDAYKVKDAIAIADRAKVDPMQYDNPSDIINAFANYKPKEKPIDPETVPELSDRREMGHGIVTYLVQNNKAGQEAMRRIINTHFGKESSPWCLLRADKEGNLLDDAWTYWKHYNKLPKRVAFKDGKLIAFMSTDKIGMSVAEFASYWDDYKRKNGYIEYGELLRKTNTAPNEEWWDRRDEAHNGIPFAENAEEGKVEHKELMPDGNVRTFKVTRGDPNVKNGTYEEWDANGTHTFYRYENRLVVEIIKTDEKGNVEKHFVKNTKKHIEKNTELSGAYAIRWNHENPIEFNARVYTHFATIDIGGVPNYDKSGTYTIELNGNDGEWTEKMANDLYDAFDKNDDATINRLINEIVEHGKTEERHSIATKWKRDVKATCMTTRANIMAKHADLFDKAKAGDMTSAYNLVKAVVKPEKVDALVKGLPKNTIVVPVHAEEKRGRNKLPIAYARYISKQTGIDYTDEIAQTVRAYHTGTGAQYRLMTNPEFDGPIEKGRSYLIVDDHITQGGTVNAMRDYIESNGGKVVAVSALTLSQGSSILSPQKDTLDELKRKWPDIDKLLKTAGVAESVEGLTESQCRYVKKFSPDTFRNLCAKAGRERGDETVRQALVNGPSEEVGSEGQERADIQTEPETPDERHSFFIGRAANKVKNEQDKFFEALKILYKEYDSTYSTKSRNDIYKRTGWWKGVDGKWRFEIADLKPKKLGKTEGKMVNGLVPYENLPYAKGGMCCNVTEICDAPELFKAYPSLKKTIVRIRDLNKEGITGSYDVNLGVIELDKRKVKSNNGKPTNVLNADGIGTITHELQHAIQYLEGFAKGGNTQDHGRTNYNKLAGEVEARNVALRTMVGKWGTPWLTEDVKRKNQIIADGYGNMRDYRGHRVERHSIARRDTETDARRAISAQAEAEGKRAANDALENYVAYFKLAHGSIPKARTIARIGLSLGMGTVDPKKILKNADKLAEQMRGTIVEQAAINGDVATAMVLAKQKKDASKQLDDLIASGVTAGGKLTHKGVGQVNALLAKRVESMMRGFTAATLADMEGDTGIDLAAEILANNPDAFETEYRRAKGAKNEDVEDLEGDTGTDGAGGGAVDYEEMSDADKYKHDQLLKEQAERVATFIEKAKERAEERGAKAAEARERRREAMQNGETDGEEKAQKPEVAPSTWDMNATPTKAGFKTPEEFAAFLRVWAADRFKRTHGLKTLAQAQQDKLFAEFYRICVRKELQDLADKLLAPKMMNDQGEMVTNPKLAKIGSGARVWVNRRIGDIERGIRPDTLERISADIFAFINKAAIRVSRVDLISSFKDELKKRFLEGKDFEELKADTERKLTGWVEEATRYIARVCDLSRVALNGDMSALEKEYARLHQIIDERARIYDESGADVTEAAKEDAETRKAQWKLALLDKYGAMRSMMPGEIMDLQNAAFDYLENEAKKLEERWAETRKQQDMVRHDLSAAIVGPGDQRYDAGKGVWGWLDKHLLDSLNGLIRLRFEHLTRFASEKKREKARDAINSILVMLGDGETAYAKALQTDREAFFEGLGTIFRTPDGKADNASIKRYLERMDETIPVELSKQLSNQGYANAMTYGQMLQLLVSLEQGSMRDTVYTNGREEQAELIRSFRFRNDKGEVVNALTKEDDAFIQWLRAFYAAKRDVLSEVTERMVGQKVDSPDPLYCPIRRFIDDKARDLHSDPTQRWDPISKIFSRRVPSTRDFDESRTIVGLFFENSKESAKLSAWAERGSFIRNVVTSPVFQAQVKRAFGPGELSKILKQLEATFNGGEQRSQTPGEVAAADKAVNFITYAYLGFNPLSALKQTTSFSVWANILPNGFADLWRHMTHVDKSAIKHLMESDEYKIRYGNKVGSGMDYATKGLNMNPNDNPVVRGIRGAGMWMLQRGDFAPGAWIAQGVYKDLLNKHLNEGMDNEAADKLAMTETFDMLEECQQSARTYNTNMLQIEHGRIGRLLTQFATSPLQQLQYETQALREWIDMVRYNMGDDKIAEARAKFRRAVVINHVLIPAAMNLVIAMYKAALGEEPPWEQDGYHWTLLIDLLMGQFSRVFFLGVFAQTTLEALLKREYPRTNQMLPIEGALGMAASGAFLVHDLATMDVEKLQKDLERAMKSTAPTRIPYNLTRRFLGDSDVDRKRRKKK